MEARRVTIKDVAMAIGVTPQTVSRVFRGSGCVSADTRIRVLDAADKLKYVPNSAAIRLRTGVAKSIAVVFDSLINVYFAIMVDYLQKELQSHGYNMQTIFVQSHTITESVYREALSHGVSAVISFLEPDSKFGDIVKDFGVPLLILGRRAHSEAFDYITTDDVMGGRLAAGKLIESGCKSFAYLTADLDITCARDRLEGYLTELKAHGYNAEIISMENGVGNTIKNYAEKHDGFPEGIFCFSDMIAYEALNVLREMGNTAVRIIGYDNIQADISIPINLTTIGVDKPRYVKSVVQLLLDKIESKSQDRIAKSIDVVLHDGETA